MMQPLAQLSDKYDVLHKLAEGGMGAIYKVRHRLLDEIRVVKVMRPHAAEDPALRRRFLREAKVAIKVRHPNVAQLFDFAMDDDGTSFIIMEFIDGVTLQDVIRSGQPPSTALAVELAVQGLQALSCLHHAGIVHRDISNDNLMLTRGYDGRPVVKLIDLGIAKDPAGEASATATGSFLGKARYAAPEQFRSGGAGSLGPSADLYAFGVVLYELLTGRLPFEGEAFAELVSGHLFEAPLPFDESDPDGRIPEGLREAVLHALDKDPAARIASADEFIERIRPFGAPAGVDLGEFERLIARVGAQGAGPQAPARTPSAEPSALVELGRSRLDAGDVATAIAVLRDGLAIDPELAEAQPLLEVAERRLAEQRETGGIEGWSDGLAALLLSGSADPATQEVLESLDAAVVALDVRDERIRSLAADCRRLLQQAENEPDGSRARQSLESAGRGLTRLRAAAGDGEGTVELETELERVGAVLEQRERELRERLALREAQAAKELARADAERDDPGGDLELAARLYRSARAHYELALGEAPDRSGFREAIERIDESLRLVAQAAEEREVREAELAELILRATAVLDEAQRLAEGTEAELEKRLAVLADGREALDRARTLDPDHADARRMAGRYAAVETDTRRDLERLREERARAEAREAESGRLFDRCRELAGRAERFDRAGIAELEQAIREADQAVAELRGFVGDDAIGRSARDLLRTTELVRGEAERRRQLLLERAEREERERELERERERDGEFAPERDLRLEREEEAEQEPEAEAGRATPPRSEARPVRRRVVLLAAAAAAVVLLGTTAWQIVKGTREDPLERGIRQVLELPEGDEPQLREKLKQVKALIPRLADAGQEERRRSLEARQERLVLLLELQRRLDNLAVHRESVETGTSTRDPAWEARQYWNTLETGITSFLGSYPNDPTAGRLRTEGRAELRRIQRELQSPELSDLLESVADR